MNNAQKEIVVLACREMCAARGEPPCGAVEPTWTPCGTCGRIAALAAEAYTGLRISVAHALEAMDGTEINPSNYNHDDVCNLNNRMVEAYGVLEDALKERAA